MFAISAIAFGALCALTAIRASPAPSSPPTASLAARACEGTEPYVRLNAADWTQIINTSPKDPKIAGYYTRLGGMGAPNSTIDLHFKDDYNKEEIRLATYKEGGSMTPGDITWMEALEAVNAGAEQPEYIVLDQEYDCTISVPHGISAAEPCFDITVMRANPDSSVISKPAEGMTATCEPHVDA